MTGHKPFIKYASLSSGLGLISMEITRITRVQSGHTSLAPHTELFMGSKSGEESEYIRLGLTRSVYCEVLSSLKGETGHRFLADIEIQTRDSKKEGA